MMKQNSEKTAVSLTNAVKRYGDVEALRGVSLMVMPGETVALLGPNGAGKTTAVSAMLGLRQLTAGTVTIYGRSPHHPACRVRMGAMLQDSGIPDTLKVWEVVDMFQRLYPNPYSVKQALEIAQLQEKADARIAKLSGGQKQRLYFALVIVGNPDILFLDEPTVALDVQGRRAFWQQIDALAEVGKTTILTTHYLEEADAVADRIVVLHKGQIIAEGTPAQIKVAGRGQTCPFSCASDQWARFGDDCQG